jgi:hypothetical protein
LQECQSQLSPQVVNIAGMILNYAPHGGQSSELKHQGIGKNYRPMKLALIKRERK